jgi:hypothetical protein
MLMGYSQPRRQVGGGVVKNERCVKAGRCMWTEMAASDNSRLNEGR